MHYENKEFPKEVRHTVSLTAEEVKLAIKELIRKEYSNVPRRPNVKFSTDVFGLLNADVTWREIERE